MEQHDHYAVGDDPEAVAAALEITRESMRKVIDEGSDGLDALVLMSKRGAGFTHTGWGSAADIALLFDRVEERIFGLQRIEDEYNLAHPEPTLGDTIAQDDEDLRLAREELQREHVDHVEIATRYFFASAPLHPVGMIAVANAHDWAAYTAGLPTYSRPGPFWVRVYREGAKLPEAAARAIFPGFGKDYRP